WSCGPRSPDMDGAEERILIRVLPTGLFPQHRACDLGERPTAGDRWRPLRTARLRWRVDQTWTDRATRAGRGVPLPGLCPAGRPCLLAPAALPISLPCC